MLYRKFSVAVGIVPHDRHLTAAGTADSGKHLQGGRLPCTVGSEQPEYFALLHAEGQIADCVDVAVAFAQIGNVNAGGHH